MTELKTELLSTIDALIAKATAKLPIDTLIDQLKDLLSKTWQAKSQAAIKNAIAKLELLDKSSKAITWEEINFIEQQLSKELGVPVAEAISSDLIPISAASYLLGKKDVGVDIMWNLPDLKSLAILDSSTKYWIGSFYDDNLQEGLRAALQDFYNGGYNRQDMATLLKTHFKDLTDKTDNYWDLLADHICTKTRVIGQVAGYEQAGIKYLKFVAHIDNKTSDICRKMNGKIIKISDTRKQVDKYFKACETNDKNKMKAAWNWNNDTVKNKQFLPPLHARCRSITIAYQP